MRQALTLIAAVLMMTGCTAPADRAGAEAQRNYSPAAGITWQTQSPDGYALSAIVEKRVDPIMFVHGSAETTFAGIADVAQTTIAGLNAEAAKVNRRFDGPVIFVYHNPTQEADKPFKLEIGYPADRLNYALGDYPVRVLEPFRCMSVTFKGPMDHIEKAYDAVLSAMTEQELKASGEMREVYLVWAGPDSAENVVEVQIGLQ